MSFNSDIGVVGEKCTYNKRDFVALCIECIENRSVADA
jgi:hypothetical protein